MTNDQKHKAMETIAMTSEKIHTIKTTKGELQYYRDWNNWEGGIRMLNPQTIKRYIEIRKGEPDCDELGVFFAFNKEQFDKAIERLTKLGKITDKTEIKYVKGFGGLYGTDEGLTAFYDFYHNRDKAIPTDCDPQEVYFYEFNNHECMFSSWSGDAEAIKIIIKYWGVDVAKTIKRFCAAKTIEQILRG